MTKILSNGGDYLRSEIVKKGLLAEEDIDKLYADLSSSTEDLDSSPKSNW